MKVNIVTNIIRGWDWSYSRMALAIQHRLKNIEIAITGVPLPKVYSSDIVHLIPANETVISKIEDRRVKKVGFLGNFCELWNKELERVLDQIDIGVFGQEQLRKDCLLHGIDKSKMTIIRPGIDLDRFKVIIRIGVVGYIRGDRDKGGEDLTKLFSRSKWKSFRFIFAGKNWEERYGSAYRKLGVNMELLGNIQYSQMPEFYTGIDYLLMPSRVEAVPQVLAEALACGRPVISTNAGWAPEFNIIHYGSIDELNKILKDIEKDWLSRRAQVESLTWDNWARKHEKLYRGLMAKK